MNTAEQFVPDLTTPEGVRKSFSYWDDLRDEGLTTPDNITRQNDILYGKEASDIQRLDVYYPKNTVQARPVIVIVHGGGWVYGDKERYQFYGMDLAQRGFTVVNYSYRLAPEHLFPAPLEDLNEVLAWMSSHAEQYYIDLNHIFLVGDSAGAQILSQYMMIRGSEQYRKQFPFAVSSDDILIRAVGLNCGVYDLAAYVQTAEQNLMKAYFGSDPEQLSEQLDTMHYLNSTFPPAHITTATRDFLKDLAEPMYQELKKRGVDCRVKIYGEDEQEQLGHVFHLDIRNPIGRKCNDEQCTFFRQYVE